MTRCFLCIALPDEVLDELTRIQSEINYKGKITFPKRENLHLTLKFFGDINDETIEDIKNSLKTIKFTPINTSISRIGIFPDLHHIRVLWAGLSHSAEIIELYNKIESALEHLNLRKDNHPFSTHITIGRVKFLKSKEELVESIKNIKVKPIEFEIKELLLKSSILTPTGAEYKILASY